MYILVYNPLSRNKRGIEALYEVINILKDEEYVKHSVLDDTYLDQILRSYTKNDTIIVIGGDGTLSKFVNKYRNLEAKICFYPGGTGNDFVRHMREISSDLFVPYYIVDKIFFEVDNYEQLIINSVGMGIDGYVINMYQNAKSFTKFSYLLNAIKAIIAYKPVDMKISIDGVEKEYKKCYFACINNTKYAGNGMMFNPTAKMDDGFLDIVILHSISKLRLLYYFPRIYKGTHIKLTKYVSHAVAKEIICKASTESYLQYDGELYPKKIKEYRAYIK